MTEPEAFSCKMCGHCCQGKGGIILTDKDSIRLADFLNMTVTDLHEKHCEPAHDEKIQLKVAEKDLYCIFYDKGCSIHSARPDICRAWPFFKGNIVDPVSLSLSLDYCHGINKNIEHKIFAKQGLEYIKKENLNHYDKNAPNALKFFPFNS